MDYIKKCLGLGMLVVALLVGFYYVSVAVPFEFMSKYITEGWFIKLGNFVQEWGITLLVILGLSRMLAINNNVAIFITLALYVLLAALVIMTRHYPDQLAELLGKIKVK